MKLPLAADEVFRRDARICAAGERADEELRLLPIGSHSDHHLHPFAHGKQIRARRPPALYFLEQCLLPWTLIPQVAQEIRGAPSSFSPPRHCGHARSPALVPTWAESLDTT